MSEKDTSMHPELAQALRAYEIEVRDGTERSQRLTLEALKQTRRRLGEAAIVKAISNEPPDQPPAPSEATAA
jgi:hypothetical protein